MSHRQDRGACYTRHNMGALRGLECSGCRAWYDADRLSAICPECDSALLARYDLEVLQGRLTPEEVAGRPSGIWRWSELLPASPSIGRTLSLGEGDTPLLPVREMARRLGLTAVWVKDEGVNPTGTFKARGLAVAVARALEHGADHFVLPTAGNAGAALAAYAARAGAQAEIFMPADAPARIRREIEAAGARVHPVDGLIDVAGREAVAAGKANGWLDLSTFREVGRVEGKKTMGFELVEAFREELPDVILYPTGGGTGLVGMVKAFDELEALGWIGPKRPRMVAVQPEGCAPIVRALERGEERAERWEGAQTGAAGLRVPKPLADRLILDVVRSTKGTGVTVSESEMRQARELLARTEGVLACLEGAATVAGAASLARRGWIKPDERVILFNTGTGLKDLL
ncbi:MAG TPA: threonine synthase [Anaerolineales bacterium]|nr:threonine synthase [Anaerolineales bacterium]